MAPSNAAPARPRVLRVACSFMESTSFKTRGWKSIPRLTLLSCLPASGAWVLTQGKARPWVQLPNPNTVKEGRGDHLVFGRGATSRCRTSKDGVA